MRKGTHPLQRLWQILKSVFLYTIASVVITAAVLLSIARALTPYLADHKADVEHFVSRVLHEPVQITDVTAGWRGLQPVLRLRSVALLSKQDRAVLLHINHLEVSIDLWDSLRHWQFEPGLVVISGAHLQMFQLQDGKYTIKGLAAMKPFALRPNPEHPNPVLQHLFAIDHIYINNVTLDWYLYDGSMIPIQKLQLKMDNKAERHHLVGKLSVQQKGNALVHFNMDLTTEDGQKHIATGDIYLHVQDLLLQKWFVKQAQSSGIKVHGYVTGEALFNYANHHWQSIKANLGLIQAEADNVTAQHLLTINRGRISLAGNYAANKNSWQFKIVSHDLRLQLPCLSTKTIPIQDFVTNLVWQQQASGIKLTAKNLYVANNDLSLAGQFSLAKQQGQSPNLSLLLGSNGFNIKAISRYLPEKVMHHKLYHWANTAFESGAVEHLTLVLQGALNDFPFDDHKGEFAADLKFKNVTLQYDPKWPALNNLSGDLQFRDRTMNVNITAGSVYHAGIVTANADIPYIGKGVIPDLQIKGNIQGRLTEFLDFLETTPLKNKIGDHLKVMSLHGPMALHLNIDVPLKHVKGHVKVQGDLQSHNASLDLSRWGIHMGALTGEVDFNNDSISAKQIAGRFLNQPVDINIVTLKPGQHDAITEVDLHGKATVNAVLKQFHLPTLAFIGGATTYQATLDLTHDPKQITSLKVQTDLQGVKIGLPKPFYKAGFGTETLNLDLQFHNDHDIYAKADLAKEISAALIYHETDHGAKLYNGDIAIGKGKVHFQRGQGLRIAGQLDKLNLADWQSVMLNNQKSTHSQAGGQEAALSNLQQLLHSIDLEIEQLTLQKQRFVRTKIHVAPGKAAWLFKLDGPGIAGDIAVPYQFDNQHQITAHLQRLYLQVNKQKLKSAKLNPATWPALNVRVQDFRYGEQVYGLLNLETRPIKQGLEIKRFMVNSGLLYINSSGKWIAQNDSNRTELAGVMMSPDLGDLLKSWKLNEFMDGKNFQMQFQLAWPETPFNPSIIALTGDAEISLGYGVLADIGKKANTALGFGRILNLLSLRSIPRRLFLNFSDLTDKGFVFDSLNGTFTLKHGVATTHDLKLKGIVANVNIDGTTDLKRELFDMNVAVMPHLTSSLPVIATLAGGPIAGIATLLANQVINPAVGQLAKRNYAVKGPWHEPLIKRLVRNDLNSQRHAQKNHHRESV